MRRKFLPDRRGFMLPPGAEERADVEVELEDGLSGEELTAERTAARVALARLHGPAVAGGTVCDWCRLPFPCPGSLVTDAPADGQDMR